MKKLAVFILSILVLTSFVACTMKKDVPEIPNALFPAIMVDSVLYRSTGEVLSVKLEQADYLGRITSVVSIKQLPTENLQGNLPVLENAPYAKHEEELAVLIEGEWTLFEKVLNNEKSEVHIKGLTILSEKGVYDIEAESQSNFIVILSNQSYENTKVNLTVFIDGNELISQECKTENQHTGYYYYYNLEGTHIVKVVSEDGQEVQETITLDENIPLWVLMSYWGDAESAKIDFNIMDSPFLWK